MVSQPQPGTRTVLDSVLDSELANDCFLQADEIVINKKIIKAQRNFSLAGSRVLI